LERVPGNRQHLAAVDRLGHASVVFHFAGGRALTPAGVPHQTGLVSLGRFDSVPGLRESLPPSARISAETCFPRGRRPRDHRLRYAGLSSNELPKPARLWVDPADDETKAARRSGPRRFYPAPIQSAGLDRRDAFVRHENRADRFTGEG